jgi:hypothetical protein
MICPRRCWSPVRPRPPGGCTSTFPLHASPVPPLAATTPVVRAGLRALVGGPVVHCDHLEVETYTWAVLPPGDRPSDDTGLIRGIAAELDFTRTELSTLGLREREVA